jgi:PAS domain S-box-containing protein
MNNQMLEHANENEHQRILALVFKKMLEITKDGFVVVDHCGIIIEISNAYCDFLGLNRNFIIGKPILDIIKNSKLPQILENQEVDIDVIHKLVRGQSPSNEKYTIVTRAPVSDQSRIVASFGQVKFSSKTMELADKLQHLDMELQYYKSELKRIAENLYGFESIVGTSESLQSAISIAKKASKSAFSVLLTGETGTGKEVFANAIHYASDRRDQPLIRINCAAIPSELLESELFGYTEGSFTGAIKGGRKGKFELADGGTIFLDEIGEMPLSMQAKLLRVLQEHEIEKIGSYKPITVDVRIIAATNKNLIEKMNEKQFREDLYYRLNVIEIKLPALRERPEDIRPLINFFLDELNAKYHSNLQLTMEALRALTCYTWPGNVRELKNAIERVYALADEQIISRSVLPANILTYHKMHTFKGTGKPLDAMMADIEKEIIRETLSQNGHNCQQTALDLGIHRSTLYKKMEKHRIL